MQKMPVRSFVMAAVVTLVTTSGCAFAGRQYPPAKWVMNNQRSVQEQPEPNRPNRLQNIAQQVWDAADASGQEGNSGIYVGGGNTSSHRPVTSGSLGVVKLPTSWSTVRTGVFGMDNDGIGVGGIEAGVRVHAPTRLTPYVGLSGDLGFSGLKSGYARHQTNVAHPNQRVTAVSGLAAVVPEAGVSYWLNSSTRVNAGASYYVTATQPDFLLFGLSLEFFSGDDFSLSGLIPTRKVVATPQRITTDTPSSPVAERSQPYFVPTDESTNPVQPVNANHDKLPEDNASGAETVFDSSIDPFR